MRMHQTARRSAVSVRASASGGPRGETTRSRRDALLLLGASTAAAVTELPTRIASAEPTTTTTTSTTATSSSPPSPAAVARAPAAPLTPRERDAVAAYELASPAVVNVFDLYLVRGGGVAFGSGAAEPEGNGSGVLWADPATGRVVVVTNYHVLASSLDRVKEDIGERGKREGGRGEKEAEGGTEVFRFSLEKRNRKRSRRKKLTLLSPSLFSSNPIFLFKKKKKRS